MRGTQGYELAFAVGCLHLPGDECARGTAAGSSNAHFGHPHLRPGRGSFPGVSVPLHSDFCVLPEPSTS